ncbi:MAG: hypothetical protein K8R35_01585 [Bacteroidales bacterium]|nr:hypothetical protein [Bacteroidales bacterium]
MKPLYGEFVELRWVRAMLIAYVLVIYLVLTSILSSGSLLYIPYSDSLSNIYFIFYFIIYMLFSILVTKIMLKKSDMVQWTEALPIFYDFAIPFSKEDIEEMKGVWRGKSNHPWLKRNVIRYVLPCSSGLIFTTVGLILGQLLWALDQCTVIFVIFVSVWLLNELYHLARKKSLFKYEKVIEVFYKTPTVDIIEPLSPKKHNILKQFIGNVCFLIGIMTIAVYSVILIFFISIYAEFPQSIISGKDFETSIACLMVYIDGTAFILAIIFQSYFWYILLQRFPHFLDVWIKRDFSIKVDVPRLPTGGFSIFLFNTILITFLFVYLYLWAFLSLFLLELYGDTLPFVELAIGGTAILILPLFFEIYLLYSTIKNRKLRESDPNNLYKDNKRIPLAAGIQLFSFLAMPSIFIYSFGYYFLGESPRFDILGMTLLAFTVSCIAILLFYIEDFRYILRKKNSNKSIRRLIKEWSYPFFIMSVLAISGLISHTIEFYYLGIFGILLFAIIYIFVVLVDEPYHQELTELFKTNGKNLYISLKFFLTLLYIYAKYLAAKSAMLLKGLADITILPLPLTLAVSTGLTSEYFSIILTILIYCVLTYEIGPMLIRPFYGDFGKSLWVKVVMIAYACISCCCIILISMLDSYSLLLLPFLILSAIPIGVVMLKKSNMVGWSGPVPEFFTAALPATEGVKREMEEIKREYSGESDYPWLKRKLIKYIPVYASGLIFTTICFFLGVLFWMFLLSTILFVIVISAWLLNDLYYLARNKSLFKFESIKKLLVGYFFDWDNLPGIDSERLLRYLKNDCNIDWAERAEIYKLRSVIGWVENVEILKSNAKRTIRIFKDKDSAEMMIDENEEEATLKISDGRTYEFKVKRKNDRLEIYVEEGILAPEGVIMSSVLSFKKHAVAKQLSGFLCFMIGIIMVALYSMNFFDIFADLQLILSEDFDTFIIGLIFSIHGLSFALAIIFQLYFWYILILRFGNFLDIWIAKKDPSVKIDVPRLPTGGFPIFLINAILIGCFLDSRISLWYLLETIISILQHICGDAFSYLKLVVVFIFIISLPLFFEIYLLYSTIKNRKEKEKDPSNLYRDNIRIPFAAAIQWLSFDIPYIVTCLIACYGRYPTIRDSFDWNIAVLLDRLFISATVGYIIVILFYESDIQRSIGKKGLESPIKRGIQDYVVSFSVVSLLFMLGWTFNKIEICYLGIFGIIVVAIGFVLVTIYGKKPVMETLDLVVIGADWGKGRRANLIGSYLLACYDPATGEFLEIGRVGTSITDEQLSKLTELFSQYIISEDGRAIKLQPAVVFEIAYEEIQKSPHYASGYEVRFPQLIQVRFNKTPKDADSVEWVRELARG